MFQHCTLNTRTQWSAPHEASSRAPDSSQSAGFLQASRCTVETWHRKGSNRTARAASNCDCSTLPPERLQSSIRPLSIPTARRPALSERSRPAHDNAVTLSRKVGKAASCLMEELSSMVHNLTVLSLDPVANWWPKGFHEHAHIILLWASCLAINW